MVELVRLGRKPSDQAKEFGCHETGISAWLRQALADELGGGKSDAPLTTAERQEFAQLRKQLRQVTMERDILAKAMAWFANKDSGIDKTTMLLSRQTRPTYPPKPCGNFRRIYKRVLRVVFTHSQSTQHQRPSHDGTHSADPCDERLDLRACPCAG